MKEIIESGKKITGELKIRMSKDEKALVVNRAFKRGMSTNKYSVKMLTGKIVPCPAIINRIVLICEQAIIEAKVETNKAVNNSKLPQRTLFDNPESTPDLVSEMIVNRKFIDQILIEIKTLKD